MTNQPAPSDTPTPRTDHNINYGDDKSSKCSFEYVDPEFARQLERELARLSAEREKERRVEQCCECDVYVSDWVEAEHRNGRICRSCESLISLRATLAERDKEIAQLKQGTIERNAAVEERDRQLAEVREHAAILQSQVDNNDVTLEQVRMALKNELAASERQKAEMEGKVEKVLGFLTEAEREIMGARFALQSLRQSTQTEEKK